MTHDKGIPDYTVEYDYERLIEEEKGHYLDIELTDDLREGGAHASDAWNYYWQKISERLSMDGHGDFAVYINKRFGHLERPIRILSLGSGYCGHELNIARRLTSDYTILCSDLNEQLFASAQEVSQTEGLNLEFVAADLNFFEIDAQGYDVIFAHASLHHVINLEHLFSRVNQGLVDGGVFHVIEVVGQDRKLIWDENEKYANALLDALPASVIGDLRIEAHEEEGMEGVRQSEILEHLHTFFDPVYEMRHGAFIRFICTNPEITRCFDAASPERKKLLDFLMAADDLAVQYGILRPLEVWGIYSPKR